MPAPTPPSPIPIRFVTLAALCLAASLAYLCRNSIGVAESTIRKELGLSEAGMSWVMSGFFLAYALGQIPAGWLAKKLGSRKAVSLFMVVWSLATAAMSFAWSLPLLIAARVANGVAQAGLFPASTASIGLWFPWSRRAVASGALASFMSIGGAVGVAVTGVMLTRIGWRPTFVAYGAVSLGFAALFLYWFRDTPAQHAWTDAAERQWIAAPNPTESQTDSSQGSVLQVLFSPPTWWICGQQFCRAAGQIFFSSWFATYLQETRGVTVQQSGFLNSLPLMGIIAGSLIGGSLSDFALQHLRSKRLARSGVAAASMLSCALCVLAAYQIEDPLLAVLAISAGTFCASVGGPCSYAVTIDMGGDQVAILFATMNMVGNLARSPSFEPRRR